MSADQSELNIDSWPSAFSMPAQVDHRLARVAQRAYQRCDLLAAHSDDPHCLTRRFCGPAAAEIQVLLLSWFRDLGLQYRCDAIGNVFGRRESRSGVTAKTFLIGSHLDTVVNAGKYDGTLGVLLGLALIELLAELSIDLPFHLEVVGFSEEEGVRFGTPMLGSRAVAGSFEPEWLQMVDSEGVSLFDAIRNFGLDPTRIDRAAYAPDRLLGYLEPHIEQGPVLENLDVPVGVVERIGGQTRAAVKFAGRASHAGTTPMDARRDALAGAAQFIGDVEQMACSSRGLLATVGQIDNQPNVPNVVPATCRLSVDVRHGDDNSRQKAVGHILQLGRRIAALRNLDFEHDVVHQLPAVTMDPELAKLLAESVGKCGLLPHRLVSGAGHDAAVMAGLTPTSMLFVRCRGGISHHPDEFVTLEDVRVALQVMLCFIMKLKQRATITKPDTKLEG